jgi:hypothetical protein
LRAAVTCISLPLSAALTATGTGEQTRQFARNACLVAISLATFRPARVTWSMFQDTEHVDARGAAFSDAGGDLINADQVIINPNSLGAMLDHTLALLHAHFP